MAEALVHNPGNPCWADLQTTDAPSARAFYGGLFGWRWDLQGEAFGHYANALLHGKQCAGLGPVPPGAPQRSHWTVYLKTEDCAASIARAREAGAQQVIMDPPMEIGPHGIMTVLMDATGAAVGLWQPKVHHGFGAIGPHGFPCWFEVNSPDMAAAAAFYQALFGLTAEKMPGMEYMTLSDDRPRHGVLQMTQEWEGVPPHWMVYFSHHNVDEAAAYIGDNGGKVHYGPFDTPAGRIAVSQDPQGAMFTVMTPAQPG